MGFLMSGGPLWPDPMTSAGRRVSNMARFAIGTEVELGWKEKRAVVDPNESEAKRIKVEGSEEAVGG